jgi:hypothetical protein
MKEIKLTKGKVTIVDNDMFDYLNQWKWFFNGTYAARNIRTINGHRRRKTYFMHHLILQPPNGMDIDHINRNPLDNRLCNLRICTRSQNRINSKIRTDNKSGVTGVDWCKLNKKWQARIEKDGKRIHLGRYDNLEDAKNAYNEKAKELYGEFILVNES